MAKNTKKKAVKTVKESKGPFTENNAGLQFGGRTIWVDAKGKPWVVDCDEGQVWKAKVK
jgi:hypothetical protein